MSSSEDRISLVRRRANEMASKFVELDNGGIYERTLPKIINAPAYILEDVQRNSNIGISPPLCFLAEITNAIVRSPGFVFTEGSILEESLVNLYGSNNLEDWMPVIQVGDNRYEARRADYFDGPTFEGPAVLLAQNSDKNYGHWIVECLPKLDLVKELYDITTLSFIIGHPSSEMFELYRDSLMAAGIAAHQLIELNDLPLHFSTLIYPGPITKHPWVISPRAINYLGRLAGSLRQSDRLSPAAERIYLPRNQIGRRCLLNEHKIQEIANKRGFTAVMPEKMSFRQQALAFSNAKIVVGNLGGAFSNIVFSPDGVRVLAATTEFMADDFFFDIVSQKKGSYVSIHGAASHPQHGMQSDFLLDPQIFEIELDRLILDTSV